MKQKFAIMKAQAVDSEMQLVDELTEDWFPDVEI